MTPRFIRRKSDSLTFTVLWWVAFITSVFGLSYYAYTRAHLVASRAFILKSTTEFYSDEDAADWLVPDIMFCTHNASVSIAPQNAFYYVDFPVGPNSNLSPEQKQLSPCFENKTSGTFFDTLHIISAKPSVPIPGASIMNIQFYPSILNSSVFGDTWLFLYVVPSENNPYKETGLRPGPYNGPDATLVRNIHMVRQASVNTYISAYTTHTRVLDGGIRGLFGLYNDSATDVSVTSQIETSYILGSFWLGYYIPSMRINNSQVPITSVTDALSSFGGAFSVVAGLFYFFFGHGRVSPFGIVQKFLLRRQTKRNLRKVYGNWKQDKDGNYYEARSSTSSTPLSSPNGPDAQSPPSSRRQHHHRPASFSSMTNLSDLDRMDMDHPTSYQGPPLQLYGRSTGNEAESNYRLQQGLGTSSSEDTLDPSKQQQFQACQQELYELKDQLRRHAKVLKHLQRHEQRFKDTETLLNEYYLDMDLVEIGGDGPSMDELRDDVSSLSKDVAEDFQPTATGPTVMGKLFSAFGNRQSSVPFKAAPSSFDPAPSSMGMGSGGSNSRPGWNTGFRRMKDEDEEAYMLVQHGASPGSNGSPNGDNRSDFVDLSRVTSPTRTPPSQYTSSMGYL